MGKLKGKTFENIEIIDISSDGRGVAKIEGQVVFVQWVVPGDIIDLKIIKARKKMLEGFVLNMVKPSPKRIEPFCQHFGTCGGCKWQNLDYNTQLDFKENTIHQQLTRIGKLNDYNPSPIEPSSNTTAYRNKLEFTFSASRWLSKEEIKDEEATFNRNALGFHVKGRYDRILHVKKCYLMDDSVNAIRNFFFEKATDLEMSFYNQSDKTGYLRNLIIRDNAEDKFMVSLVVKGELDEKATELLNSVQSEFPQIISLNYIVNTKTNDSYNDLTVTNFSGVPFITETLNRNSDKKQIKYQINPLSFFQTNTAQAEFMYNKVVELAGLTGAESVFDLYCGTGSIACFVAEFSKSVIGVEYVKEAVDDAFENAKINNLNNSDFIAGDLKDIIANNPKLKGAYPDVIITDPPRSGMHPDVINAIMKTTAKRIVYVSCNPATQARDIDLMSAKYSVTKSIGIDMFPHTHHSENIVLLELK